MPQQFKQSLWLVIGGILALVIAFVLFNSINSVRHQPGTPQDSLTQPATSTSTNALAQQQLQELKNISSAPADSKETSQSQLVELQAMKNAQP